MKLSAAQLFLTPADSEHYRMFCEALEGGESPQAKAQLMATWPIYAMVYQIDHDKIPWRELEVKIAVYHHESIVYATKVLNGRFRLYEEIVAHKSATMPVWAEIHAIEIGTYANELKLKLPDAWHEYEMERGSWRPSS